MIIKHILTYLFSVVAGDLFLHLVSLLMCVDVHSFLHWGRGLLLFCALCYTWYLVCSELFFLLVAPFPFKVVPIVFLKAIYFTGGSILFPDLEIHRKSKSQNYNDCSNCQHGMKMALFWREKVSGKGTKMSPTTCLGFSRAWSQVIRWWVPSWKAYSKAYRSMISLNRIGQKRKNNTKNYQKNEQNEETKTELVETLRLETRIIEGLVLISHSKDMWTWAGGLCGVCASVCASFIVVSSFVDFLVFRHDSDICRYRYRYRYRYRVFFFYLFASKWILFRYPTLFFYLDTCRRINSRLEINFFDAPFPTA